MKKSAWDKQLWQDKMQQLPLEGDEHAMWQNMQALLDKNMPVNPSGTGRGTQKNFPGAGTILSAIVIISAVTILLFHLLNASHTGKQKPENKITKLQADSLHAINNSSNNDAVKPKAVVDKNHATTDILPQAEANKSSKTNAGTGQKDSSTSNKNTAPNASGAINEVLVNSGANKKLPGNNAADKNAGIIKQGNNNIKNQLAIANSQHSVNNTLVSGNQNSRNAYLQKAGAKGKAGHYFGQHDKNSAYQQNWIKNHNDHAANRPDAGEQQQTGNIKADSTSIRQKTGQDTIASLLTVSRQIAHNDLILSNTLVSTIISPVDIVNKQTAQNNALNKNQSAKSGKLQGKSVKNRSGNSKFELDLRLGYNTGAGSSAYPGISAGIFFTPKIGVLVGADVMAARTLSGSYNNKMQLTYRVDTGKSGIRQSGQIIISGSRKIYTIDVPVTAHYRINQNISLYGGPVISIPAKANAIKPTLTKLANSNDTTRSLVAPYVSATTINTKPDFGFTGGIQLNFNRFFISGSYLQDMQSYTISSGLGSGKISRYHTVQFGIGYRLFKPKNTKP